MLGTHQIVVATPAGTPLGYTAKLGGEYHLIAVAFSNVGLTATGRDGYPLTLSSVLEPELPKPNASVVAEANAGDVYSLKLAGTGCALVMGYRRF